MPNELANQYLIAKQALEAKEDLRALRVICFPKLKENGDRRKEVRNLERIANPELGDMINTRKSVDTKGAFEQLGMMLNG